MQKWSSAGPIQLYAQGLIRVASVPRTASEIERFFQSVSGFNCLPLTILPVTDADQVGEVFFVAHEIGTELVLLQRCVLKGADEGSQCQANAQRGDVEGPV